MTDDRDDTTTRPEGGRPRAPRPIEDPHLGKTIAGRYRIEKKLGEGGMGAVYLAEHVMIEKKVAIKILSGDYSHRGEILARFAQEAKAASRIGHPNIIGVTDFGPGGDGPVFIVMEYLQGRDLRHHLTGPMEAHRIAVIMGQVLLALEAAHKKGIVHRDLKPENIFLVEREGVSDLVKLLDFGIARVSSPSERPARLTRTGTIFGTAEYMSPEQARGNPTDGRADVYAAGCILYELLTGHVPFEADSFMGVLRRQVEEAPVPPSQRAPERGITPALETVVLRALEKEREARYASASEMLEALAVAMGEPVPVDTTPPEPPPEPGPRARRWWMAAPVVALLAGGAWLALPSRPQRPAETPAPPIAVAPPPAAAAPAPATTPAESGAKATIVSIPSGAQVRRGTEVLGTTPFVLAVSGESAAVELTLVKKDYKEQAFRVAPGHSSEYAVSLSKVAARPAAAAPRPAPGPLKPAPTTPAKPAPRPQALPELKGFGD
jgi:serine/threonine-protein kinase